MVPKYFSNSICLAIILTLCLTAVPAPVFAASSRVESVVVKMCIRDRTYVIVTDPAHGTLTGTGANRTYTPAANYNGADSFTFKVNDGTMDSAVATVSVNITFTNVAPVASPQSVSTNEDTAKAITLAGTDADGDTLTYVCLLYTSRCV